MLEEMDLNRPTPGTAWACFMRSAQNLSICPPPMPLKLVVSIMISLREGTLSSFLSAISAEDARCFGLRGGDSGPRTRRNDQITACSALMLDYIALMEGSIALMLDSIALMEGSIALLQASIAPLEGSIALMLDNIAPMEGRMTPLHDTIALSPGTGCGSRASRNLTLFKQRTSAAARTTQQTEHPFGFGDRQAGVVTPVRHEA